MDDVEPKEESSGSGIKRDREEGEGDMDIAIVENLVDEWFGEIREVCDKTLEDEKEMETAWDDVHGGDLPIKDVRAARKEEI